MRTELETNGDAFRELIAMRDTVLREMPESKNDRVRLRAMSDWLGRELDLESKYQAILGEAARLIAACPTEAGRVSGTSQPVSQIQSTRDVAGAAKGPPHSGGKDKARQWRSAYIVREQARGQNLTRLRSVYYSNEEGRILGITYSGEKQGTWFLNLQYGQFQEAVLLCETGAEIAQVVHLPRPFFERYGQQLSQDGKGQTKFNLARRNGRFVLQIPGPTGWVDVQEYVDGEPLALPVA